jgi:hypothetical protein
MDMRKVHKNAKVDEKNFDRLTNYLLEAIKKMKLEKRI